MTWKSKVISALFKVMSFKREQKQILFEAEVARKTWTEKQSFLEKFQLALAETASVDSEEEEENHQNKLESFHPLVKASLAPFVRPVPANDREMVEQSETHYKVIDQ